MTSEAMPVQIAKRLNCSSTASPISACSDQEGRTPASRSPGPPGSAATASARPCASRSRSVMSFQVQPAPRIAKAPMKNSTMIERQSADARARCRRRAPPTTSTASAAARIRSAGRDGRAADRAATRTARAYRPSCRSRRQRGPSRRSSGARSSRENVAVQRIEGAAALLRGVASERRRRAQHFAEARAGRPALLRLLRHGADLLSASSSVFLWPFLSCSPICGGIPHFAELVSTYLIILTSAWPKLPISLQASSGGALRSLAALISLPRFSASSRSGTKSFMQASGGPPMAAPAARRTRRRRPARRRCSETTSGRADRRRGRSAVDRRKRRGIALAARLWPGNGAGNAPCAKAWPRVDGHDGHGQRHNQAADDQGCFSGKVQQAPTSSDTKRDFDEGFLRFLTALNNPSNWATARRGAAPNQ